MTKPKKLRDSRMKAETDERVLPVVGEAYPAVAVELEIVAQDADSVTVQPKRYTPPNCSMCTELRPKPTDNYVDVHTTRREDGHVIRYCKCKFCNNTFKHIEKM